MLKNRSTHFTTAHIALLGGLLFQPFAHASTTTIPKAVINENVIVVHGFGQNEKGMAFITDNLTGSGYKTCALNYKTVGHSIESIQNQVTEQINHCFARFNNPNKTHFIGHSLGGLMIRQYLADTPTAFSTHKIDKVIMMGTPNHGSPISDAYQKKSVLGLLGEMSLALGTDKGDFAQSLPLPSYKTGIIAGNKPWRITQKAFNEPNDGLVPVSSTRLPNMGDFIELNTDHASMRTSQTVMNHILNYLTKGQFV